MRLRHSCAPLVYHTSRERMSNGGHLHGVSLGEAARSDLLEYLRGLQSARMEDDR
jgi:hypothetical protein